MILNDFTGADHLYVFQGSWRFICDQIIFYSEFVRILFLLKVLHLPLIEE